MEALELKERHPTSWNSHEFRAMGSHMAIWLDVDDPGSATEAFDRVEALFAVYEEALSRFRPESELSKLNRQTGQWVVISDLLWDVLTHAIEMASITDGYFDPTMLNALEQHGYTVSFEQLVMASQNVPSTNSMPFLGNWTSIELDAERQAIFLPDGIRVDLGGIAKGYTAQQAVDLIRPYGPCLIDAGGDLAAGDAPENYPGWPVAVSSPQTNDSERSFDLCELWLANQALTTSGIDYRTWERDGQMMHHLMDPSTGAPAGTDCLTVTILANDAAWAEAWATATIVAGSVSGVEKLRQADIAGLIVTQSNRILVTPAMSQILQLPLTI